MKLIVDIPEYRYKKLKEYFANDDCGSPNDLAIAKGIPIVQCKECDYWEKSENSLQGRCCLLQCILRENGFAEMQRGRIIKNE